MGETAVVVILLALVVVGAYLLTTQKSERRRNDLEDAKADARRWVERLGGQVLNLVGTDTASRQAIADASERYTAAGSQLEQANTVHQAQLVTDTALEGLYYVRAARSAMGLDPGPDLPEDRQRARAGKVTEQRGVDVEGHHYEASPQPGQATPHYYPGGHVAGRVVPEGWYSEPWWRPAVRAGAWGMGSALLFTALFSGMYGVPEEAAAMATGTDADHAADPEGVDGAGMEGDDWSRYADPSLGGSGDFGGFDGGGFDA